jgi:hypothetical protein
MQVLVGLQQRCRVDGVRTKEAVCVPSSMICAASRCKSLADYVRPVAAWPSRAW